MNRGLEAPREPIITYYFFLLKNIYIENQIQRYVTFPYIESSALGSCIK